MITRQKGMTAVGMMMTGIFVIMFSIILMRVIPVYIQHQTIMQSIENLKDLPVSDFEADDVSVNTSALRKSLLKNFEVNNIDEKMFDDIAITPKENSIWEIAVKYKVIKPLISNISLLFDFNDTKEVTIAKS